MIVSNPVSKIEIVPKKSNVIKGLPPGKKLTSKQKLKIYSSTPDSRREFGMTQQHFDNKVSSSALSEESQS